MEDTNENRRLIRDSMRRPIVRERFAATMRRERAVRFLLETVGGVDFAALEAEAAAETQAIAEAAEDVALADPVEDAVDEIVEEQAANEIAERIVGQVQANAAASGESAAEVAEPAAEASTSDEKPRQASGDTPA
jgi:hypothetical protein